MNEYAVALLQTFLISLLPIFELRGAIPYAIFHDIHPAAAYGVAALGNSLIGLLVYLFLTTMHPFFQKIPPYRYLFDRIVRRARAKVEGKVEKYGYLGLMLFVAIPLPVTGAWTGALGAWMLGVSWKKTAVAITLGVLIAGVVVTAISLAVQTLGSAAPGFFRFLIKEVH